MRYLILLLAIAALPAIAFDVVVNGENVGQTDKLVIDNGRVVINTEGQADPEPEPEPKPEPEPSPDPKPSPGAGCKAQDVICTNAWRWPDGESRTAVTIPKGKTLSTPFATTGNINLRGTIEFEARSDTTPNTDIWISTTPGGKAYTNGTFNSFYCQQRDESFKYSIRWYQYDSSRGCSLQTNTRYYFNIRHSRDDTPRSYTHRWRTYNQ